MTHKDSSLVSPSRGGDHDHGQCRSAALKTLERQCASRRLRLTPLRRQIFEILCRSHRASGAYEVLDRLSEQRPGVRPPTVYRGLDFLVEHGFAHRLEALNAYVVCGDPSAPHSGQFLICEDCGHVAEMADTTLTERVERTVRQLGFQPRRQQIEVLGQCADCR